MSSQLPAIELLKLGDEDRTKPVLNQYWPEIIGTGLGIASGVFINFGTRRPVFSGIQKHVLGVAGWVAVLTFAQKRRNEYFAERDAVYRHYIELHPEDFPIPGSIFEIGYGTLDCAWPDTHLAGFYCEDYQLFIKGTEDIIISNIVTERKKIGDILEPWIPVR